MARINLLPWREAKRAQRQMEFYLAVAASALLMVGVIAYVHFFIGQLIAHQEMRNSYLNQQIRALERQIKEIKELDKTKSQLLSRMDVIQQLQRSRPESVQLIDALVRMVPEGVQLQSIKQSESVIDLEGMAESNARVSALMRNIANHDLFGEPRLDIITNKEYNGVSGSYFKLQVERKKEPADS